MTSTYLVGYVGNVAYQGSGVELCVQTEAPGVVGDPTPVELKVPRKRQG